MTYTLFVYKNVVFPAQAGYSHFSVDFRLEISILVLFLNYSLVLFFFLLGFVIKKRRICHDIYFCAV